MQTTLNGVGYQVELETPRTPQSRRVIDLDPRTVGVLRRWRARQLEEAMLGGGRPDRDTLVFTKPDGSWIHPDWVSDHWARIIEKSDLPTIRLHDLRHTHASMLLAAGVPVRVVSERLGHASVAFTLQVYQHLIPGMQADAANLFNDLVYGEKEAPSASDDGATNSWDEPEADDGQDRAVGDE